jgi:hypothetical protein
MRGEQQRLFTKGDLGPTLDNILKKALGEVESMDANHLLQVSETDLVDHIVHEYPIEPVSLLKDQMYVTEPQEVDIDIAGDPNVFALPGQPVIVRGVAFSVVVPFTGSEVVFYCRPTTFDFNPPVGRIESKDLYLDFRQTQRNSNAIKKTMDQSIAHIEGYLQSGEAQVRQYSQRLVQEVRQAIAARKNRLLANQGLVASLGLPMKRRDVPSTYSIPIKPLKPRIQMPAAATAPYKPEPALPDAEYEHIIEILGNMALAMERSPRTFAKLEEEEIRDHFLVQLNGYYEGQATGETFNYEGKTDILIRSEGRTVFIAECLIWRGEAYLAQKVDQILGYTSWRDTKTAIVIFSRNKDFSSVIAKIPQAISAHPNCKKQLAKKGETQFRYLFHHREDRNRELIVTVVVFNVPNLDA